MVTRSYQFINGPESSAIPSLGDPSDDSDFVTLGYANKHYLQGGLGIADAAALRALDVDDLTDKDVRLVEDLERFYYYDSTGTGTDDSLFIIQPTVGAGRWFAASQPALKIANFNEQTTPANPAANQYKIYFKNDGNLYKLNSAGLEAGLGGGGGGGSINWNAAPGTGPLESFEAGEKVFLFGHNLSQKLTAFIRVPGSYAAGSEIKANIGIFSEGTSNNIRMQATTYLIRSGTDAVDSTTNSNLHQPAEITLDATAKKMHAIELELSSATGTINSVAISSGDLLRVDLERYTAGETISNTSDAEFMPTSTEVTFS